LAVDKSLTKRDQPAEVAGALWEALMHMHQVMAWPPIAFRPAKKAEPRRKSKAAEEALETREARTLRVPPPKRRAEDDEAQGEALDIVV
jgi:hypothetical protein